MPLTYSLRPKMTEKFICAFSKILWDTDLIASRFMLFLAEVLWGILLLWPGDSFNRFYYHNMLFLAPENVWGVLFLITGILQFIIIMRRIFHSMFARIFAVWNSIIWLVTIFCLAAIYPPSAAISGEISLAIVALWIFLRPYILSKGYKYAS